MIVILICIFLWNLLYNKTNYCSLTHRGLRKNIISFTHSTLCTMIAYTNIQQKNPNYSLLYYFSFSYFSWDILYIIFHKDWKDLLFIYHHIICLISLVFLINNINSSIINEVYFLGEASNFFNYIVYHCIKLKYFKKNLIILKIIQFIWFFYFRTILITNFIYNNFHKLNNKYFGYIFLTIHFLSFLWIYKQFNSIIKYLTY